MVDIKIFFLFHNNVPEHFKGLGLNIVFNATFNNISTISGRLVLLVQNPIAVERGKLDTSDTQLHDLSLFWLSTDTSIKRGGVKLVIWAQTYTYTFFIQVGDLGQVGGFLRVLRFPPPIKLTAPI
jgi:hypothetical protein